MEEEAKPEWCEGKDWMKTRCASSWGRQSSWMENGDSKPKRKAGRGERIPNPEGREGNGRDCEPVTGQSYWYETEGPIEEAAG